VIDWVLHQIITFKVVPQIFAKPLFKNESENKIQKRLLCDVVAYSCAFVMKKNGELNENY